MISKAVKWKVSAALTLTAVVTAAGIGAFRSLSESETTLSQFKPVLLTQFSSSFKDNSGWIYAIALSPDGSGGGLVDGLLGMMMWNQTSQNGENRGESPVVNLQTSEPAAKLPIAKVNSVKPPASGANSPVANSEADINSRFDELPFDDRSFS